METTFRRTPLALAVAGILSAGVACAQPAPGDPLGAEFVVNQFTAGPQGGPFNFARNAIGGASIAMAPDGRFVILWAGDGADDNVPLLDTGSGVFMRLFDAAGAEVLPETRVNATVAGNQQNPSVAMADDGRFVVVWDTDGVSVTARLFASDGSAVTAELPIDNASASVLFVNDPDVAVDGTGGFIVTWERDGGGGATPEGDIFFRRFDATGNPLEAPTVIDDIVSDQFDPAVAMSPVGDAVVSWVNLTGSTGDIRYAQIPNAGAPGPALDAQTTAGEQDHPDVDVADNGDFAIAWTGDGPQDLDQRGVSLRRFQADGTPYDATEIQVNTTIAGEQNQPDLCLDANGEAVVTWMTLELVNDNFDVYFQRYANPAGGLGAQGPETLLTTSNENAAPGTRGDQFLPAVACDADGNFTATWTDDGGSGSGDGSLDGVMSRRFQGPSGTATPIDVILRATASGLVLGPLALALAGAALWWSLWRRRARAREPHPS